jgi:hypothetical protein
MATAPRELSSRRVHAVSAAIAITGAACSIFQVVAPFRGVWQFLTVQLLFVAAALTYARALRWRFDPTQFVKARLILRGNILALASVAATAMLDVIATVQRHYEPYRSHAREPLIAAAIVAIFASAAGCAAALARAFRNTALPPPPSNLTVADGLEDLWTLVRIPATWNLEQILEVLSWVHPRRHPWRFTCALGAAAGLLLFLAHLQEGAPPTLRIGLLIAAILIGVEFVGTLLGFALFGGLLGLRPRARTSPLT